MLKNKNFLKNYITIMMISLIFTGCAQKVQIKAIKSAKITNNSIKNIGVASFENDNISQSIQVNSAISNVQINNKKYFNLVDKKNIDLILNEQKLNDSGLVNLIHNTQTNGLSQIETLVVGKVLLNNLTKSYFYENRTDYETCVKTYTSKGKTYCEQYRRFNISCQANKYTVKTKIKLIQVNNAEILFADTYDVSSRHKHCSDDTHILPTRKIENTKLAKIIANQLIKDIAPSYVYFSIELLDDVDIDMTDKQETLFENALEMIKYKRIQKANQMLHNLNTQLKSKSYVVLYNLALTEESLGDINQAYQFLKKAEDISLKTDGIIEEIVIYMKKMQENLSEKSNANKQL